jgi:hypothetical protein
LGTIEFWGRLTVQVDVPLRRGGWYRVVSHTALEAVVGVAGGQAVPVPRPYLEIRVTAPTEWTVLRNPTVAARTPDVFRRGYLVCPGCRNRVPLPPAQVSKQLCPSCSQTFSIAWRERYLEKSLER